MCVLFKLGDYVVVFVNRFGLRRCRGAENVFTDFGEPSSAFKIIGDIPSRGLDLKRETDVVCIGCNSNYEFSSIILYLKNLKQ